MVMVPNAYRDFITRLWPRSAGRSEGASTTVRRIPEAKVRFCQERRS
jgi:hypothetical protein